MYFDLDVELYVMKRSCQDLFKESNTDWIKTFVEFSTLQIILVLFKIVRMEVAIPVLVQLKLMV